MVSNRVLNSILFFLVGFAFGVFIYTLVFAGDEKQFKLKTERKDQLAEKLSDEIKVLCMIMTNPKSHNKKAIHVKNTWGKRCNKLLFITSQEHPELDTIVVHVNESRKALRRKAREAFLYAFDNHHEEFDWFLKADDDKYLIKY